jgi:phenylalanyl-tRNA synthetase alpha chain
MYILTKEGKEYLERGLPERRLIELISKKHVAVKQLKGMGIAINWARKNNWIKIIEGKASLTDKGKSALKEKTVLELSLFELSEGREVSSQILMILEDRKLVEKRKLQVTIKGNEINQLTSDLIISGAWKKYPLRKYDVCAPAPEIFPGKKQAYRAFLDEVKEEFVSLGFSEALGPTVESAFYNCDALYMPQDHPARTVQDIYFVKGKAKLDKQLVKSVKNMHESGGFGSKGWGVKFSEDVSKKLLLRSHASAITSRTLASGVKTPGKFFSLARVYRPDVVDATHLTEFNQLDGTVIGKDINFRNLLGMLSTLAKKVAGVEKIKFLPGYFPFTEPSVETYIYHPKLKKWIEVIPGGMWRPELTKPLGIHAPVFSFSIGIDRLFMIKEGISDIRQLFSYDLNWLRKSRL